jgi:hypothetical protein
MTEINHYQEIGVYPNASSDTIRERLEELIGCYSAVPEEIDRIHKIGRVLLDPVRRGVYDNQINREQMSRDVEAEEKASRPGFIKAVAERLSLVTTYSLWRWVFAFWFTYGILAFFNGFIVFHKGDFGPFEYFLIGWSTYEWTLARHVRNKLTSVRAPGYFFPTEGSIWLSSTICFGTCILFYQITHSAFVIFAGQPAMWISLHSLVRLLVHGDYDHAYHAANHRKSPDIVNLNQEFPRL